MALQTNIDSFRLGEDWVITINCQDSTGAPLDLTDGDLKFRLADLRLLTLYLDLSLNSGVSIPSPASGQAVVLVTAAMQASAGMNAGTYRYEAQAVLVDGSLSDQAAGVFTVADSLFDASAFG